jgi:hypothetical protein
LLFDKVIIAGNSTQFDTLLNKKSTKIMYSEFRFHRNLISAKCALPDNKTSQFYNGKIIKTRITDVAIKHHQVNDKKGAAGDRQRLFCDYAS